jgi:hypothetical protein
MAAGEHPSPNFRRIVLALDPGADLDVALAEAVRLATRLQAELTALFVEDARLLGASTYPFVRRYSPSRRLWESFGERDMEEALQSLAEKVRHTIEEVATRDRLRWSFEVVRGEIEAAALAAAAETDLVILGAGLDRLFAGHRPSLARLGGLRARRSVLVMRPETPGLRRVAVVHDGSEGADRALAAALALIDADGVTVVLATADAPAAEKLEAALRARLGEAASRVTFEHKPGATAEDLCAAAAHARAGLLVLGADNPLLDDAPSVKRLEETSCRVLVIH